MIKLIIIARCMPEDVYPRSIEQPTAVLPGEKKFSVVVREPESWYIGRLALEIKKRYESLYKREFGKIKYLKDGEDDCDLDPELFVADLLVDEGKAARDGADQKRVVKVIQEQGRAIREGSVIPDLTRPHYEPPARPPVPKFLGVEKRNPEDNNVDDRPSKRRRLDQIDEDDGEDIVHSIEGNLPANAINGDAMNLADVEPKQESPESIRPWVNTTPATRDELELLPQPPENWQQRSRPSGLPVSNASRPRATNMRSTSDNSRDLPQAQPTPSTNGGKDHFANRLARQYSLTNVQTPITPPYTANASRTPGAQAVSMLNGMKSASPVLRQSTSSSANKFRKQKRDIFDHPESEIEDSQMSPGSRAAKSKITPKLVRTPQSGNSIASTNSALIPASTKQDTGLVGETQTGDRESTENIASRKSLQLPKSRYLMQDKARPQPEQAPLDPEEGSSRSKERAHKQHKAVGLEPMAIDVRGNSTMGSDDGSRARRRKSTQSSKSHSKSGTDVSASRSSSAASSSRLSDKISLQRKKVKRIAPTRIADNGDQYDPDDDDDGALDSPGAQLEESLRRSSPVQRKSKEPVEVVLPQRQSPKDKPHFDDNTSRGGKIVNSTDDIERSPDSVSDSGEIMPPLKKPERQQVLKQSKGKRPAEDLRCFTCWGKQNRCDNKKPKCSACEKNRKNCQFYSMTKEAAQKEKEDRQANASRNGTARSTPKPSVQSKKKTSKPRSSQELVSATDMDEDSTDQAESHASKIASEKYKPSSEVVEKPRRTSETHLKASDSLQNGEVDAHPQEKKIKDSAKPARSESKPAKTPSLAAEQSNNIVVPEDREKGRNRSAESQAASDSRIMPDGMSLEEYDQTIKNRAGLTEEQRRAQKLLDRNAQKQKSSTPVVLRSQGSQDLAKTSSKGTPSVLSDEKVPSSLQESSKTAQAHPATSSWKAVNSITNATQVAGTKADSDSVPVKLNTAKSTTSKSAEKAKLKAHPTIATTAASLDSNKHQNPPFRPPQQKSLPATPAVASVGTPKSIVGLRARLDEQKRTTSSASTPQPQTAAAKLVAKNQASKPKKGFSLDDDEDEDEDADDETTSEEDEPKSRPATTTKSSIGAKSKPPASTTPGAASSTGIGQVTVRRCAPTPSDDDDDDDSDSSGPAEW